MLDSVRISMIWTRKQALKVILLAPFLFVIFVGWGLAAAFEVVYYYLKGYSWDPIHGGYWHRKTGDRA